MLSVRVSCFVVRGCAVLRRYIDVCNCDVCSVVYVYHDHLKFCIMCINGRRYVCCGECNVVSNECDEPIPCLVQSFGAHGGTAMYFRSVCFRGDRGSLNCDYICMCVVNKQFEFRKVVLNPVYVDVKYNEMSLTFIVGSVCLCGICSHVVALGLSVRFSWYPMWMRWFR